MKRFIEIARECAYVGHFPDCWKRDVISFLFKRKGQYEKPKFWRPITIAVSLGKHLEKVVSYFLNLADDGNTQNHAYTPRKSCLTAIIDLQAHLRRARALKSCHKDQEIVYGVSADDIASAFESVDHRIVIYAIRCMFHNCEIIKIDRLVESYLTRESMVTDHETGQLLVVIRAFAYKTIPQGSILSPKLWRIYDLTFSLLYENSLKRLITHRLTELGKEPLGNDDPDWEAITRVELEYNQAIICYAGLTAYADDHVTVVAIMIKKLTPPLL